MRSPTRTSRRCSFPCSSRRNGPPCGSSLSSSRRHPSSHGSPTSASDTVSDPAAPVPRADRRPALPSSQMRDAGRARSFRHARPASRRQPGPSFTGGLILPPACGRRRAAFPKGMCRTVRHIRVVRASRMPVRSRHPRVPLAPRHRTAQPGVLPRPSTRTISPGTGGRGRRPDTTLPDRPDPP
jgi:hypothetical protein